MDDLASLEVGPGVFYSLGIADPACKREILQELVPLLLRTKSLAPEDDDKESTWCCERSRTSAYEQTGWILGS